MEAMAIEVLKRRSLEWLPAAPGTVTKQGRMPFGLYFGPFKFFFPLSLLQLAVIWSEAE